MGRTKSVSLIGIATVLVIALGIGIWYTQKGDTPRGFTGAKETVRLGFTHNSLEALLIIAQEKGYFSEEGLDVTFREYPTGKIALLDGLFEGEVDIVSVAEVPIVFNSFARQDFKVFATIGMADDQMKIIARRDSGIETPEDLKGKRIGTQRGSAAHVFLHHFLLDTRLSDEEVIVSFLKAVDLPAALAKAEVDAIAVKEPFIGQAKDLLADNSIIFHPRGIYRKTFNLTVLDDFVEARPQTLIKVLRALVNAEGFAKKNRGQALETFLSAPGISRTEVQEQWPTVELTISLAQDLLIQMEFQAKWAIDRNLVDAMEIPNYLDFLYLNALNEVNPQAIKVIR